MLNIINDNCTNLMLTSPLLAEWSAAPESQLLSVDTVVNCCEDQTFSTYVGYLPTNLQLQMDPNTMEYYVTILPEYFSEEEFFEGPHYFTVKLVKADGTVKTDSLCLFIDCNLKCLIADFIADNPDDTEVHNLYLALQYINACDSCKCDNNCNIYNKLITLLNQKTDGTTDCGCVSKA